MSERDVTTNVYNPKVKVTGWEQDGSEPRDNDPYKPCNKNYFLSTHKRLGSDDSKLPISTTREMQQQVFSNSIISKKCGPPRSKGEPHFRESCQYLMREGTGVQPMDYFVNDYTTTNNYDYRHPNPHMEKPPAADLSPPPAIYNKISFCGRQSLSKFLDDAAYTSPERPGHRKPPPYVNLDMYYSKDVSETKQNIHPCIENKEQRNGIE